MDFQEETDRAEMENISPDSPEEEDDDESVRSSVSSSDFSSDESDLDSPMNVEYSKPNLDKERIRSATSPGAHRTVHIVDDMNVLSKDKSSTEIGDNKKSQLSGEHVDDSTKTAKKTQESNSQRIEINIKNEKSFNRVSIDDHVELDFDESEDEDMRRDWRHEKRVTQDQVESDDGAIESDDEEEKKTPVKISRTIREEGEDDDCEEGEIKSSDDDTSSPDEEALDEIENPQYYEERIMCRYFQWGNCHFGMSCRFLHPGVNDYDYGPPPPQQQYQPPARAAPPPAQAPTSWTTSSEVEKVDKPVKKARSPSPTIARASPPTESAWERGLRHAKKMRELSKKRKEKETNFEEKRMNLSLEVTEEVQQQEQPRPKSVAKEKPTVTLTREMSDDKENIENEKQVMPKEREPSPEEPYSQQDPYYDKNYQDDYYDDHSRQEGPPGGQDDHWPGGGGRNQQYDNYYVSRGGWDHREQDYPPQSSNFRGERPAYNKDFPPNRGKYGRGGGGYDYREPPYPRNNREPLQGPPRDVSPDKEREYWDRRREEDFKKFKKFDALRDGNREEEPVNRIRGEQWSDPWARVKEPPRRKGSRSRSHSRGKKGKRSFSGSSSSSFSSRSRSSYSSSSYSSRSSYSSSSSRSRSRSKRKSKEKRKPIKLHARPPKSSATSAAAITAATPAAAKPVEGPPKSTVTKVSQPPEEKRSVPTAPHRMGRDSDRERPGQPANRGPPKGPPKAPPHAGSRERGAPSKSGGSGPPPPSSRSSGPPPGGRMGGPPGSNRVGGPPPSGGRTGGGPPGGRPGGGPSGGRPGGGQAGGRPSGGQAGGRLGAGPPPSSRLSGDQGPPSRSGGKSATGNPKSAPPSRGGERRDPVSHASKGPLHQRIDKVEQSGRDADVQRAPFGGQKRDDGAARAKREQQSQRTGQSPKVVPGGGSSDRERNYRNSRQLPGRMRPKARSYSSSSSSRSRSRSHSRSLSRSRSRSSRGHSLSSNSSSSSTGSSYSSSSRDGSPDSQHMYKGIRGLGQRDVRRDAHHGKPEVDRAEKSASHYNQSGPNGGGRREPHPSDRRDFNRDRRPPAHDRMAQGRPPVDQYGRPQRDGRDDRRGDRPFDKPYTSRSGRPNEQANNRDNINVDPEKSGIKLTLKSNDKVTRPVKRSISNGSSDVPPKKGKMEESQDQPSKKSTGKSDSSDKSDGPVGGGSKNAPSGEAPKKKSTSSRREELLKQLKAVENAITRKRSKMS